MACGSSDSDLFKPRRDHQNLISLDFNKPAAHRYVRGPFSFPKAHGSDGYPDQQGGMARENGDLASELKILFLAPEDDNIDLFFFQGLSVGRNDLQNKVFVASFLALFPGRKNVSGPCALQ